MRKLNSTLRFSILRLLLGTAFIALPFSAFREHGQLGLIVSTVIAVPMFIACWIASRAQLQSMLGIIGCTTIGLLVGVLYPSFGRPYDTVMRNNFFAIIGCVVGLLWSELSYAREDRDEALHAITRPSTKTN